MARLAQGEVLLAFLRVAALIGGRGCRRLQRADVGDDVEDGLVVGQGLGHRGHRLAVEIVGVGASDAGFEVLKLALEVPSVLAGDAGGVQVLVARSVFAVARLAQGEVLLAFFCLALGQGGADEKQPDDAQYPVFLRHVFPGRALPGWRDSRCSSGEYPAALIRYIKRARISMPYCPWCRSIVRYRRAMTIG